MVEELISTLSKEIRTSITEDTSVPRNVRTNVVTGLETYLLNEKDERIKDNQNGSTSSGSNNEMEGGSSDGISGYLIGGGIFLLALSHPICIFNILIFFNHFFYLTKVAPVRSKRNRAHIV